jgi:hypothetical protein
MWLYLRNASHFFANGSTWTTRPFIFEPAPITFFTCSEPMFAGNETEDGRWLDRTATASPALRQVRVRD